MRRSARLVLPLVPSLSLGACLALGVFLPAAAPAQAAPAPAARAALPASGTALLQRMHDAYAGKWFRTLTFVQKTTFPQPDGTSRVQTWYEATRAPSELRIDIGDRAAGNGMIFRGDSTFRFRAGTLASAAAQANPLLPFVIGVYHQPVATTIAQLGGERIDLARVSETTWEGRRTFVVGAGAGGDSLAPQFWVDAERLVLVRMISRPAERPETVVDIRMLRYEPLAGGWIAPWVEILVNGRLAQLEEYSEMRPNVPLDAALFDVGQWTTAKWWR